MRCVFLLIGLFLVVPPPNLVAQSAALPEREDFHLFLLVGQSNMAGRGKVAPEDKVPHPRVLMLDKQGEWKPAVDPLHFDKPIAGVGLGRTFGQDVAERKPDVTVGLIPCAVGGSPIDSWKPGAFYRPTRSHPWDDAVRRTKIAMKDGVLKGILWHQGESDSKPELASEYGAKLVDLVERLRREFDSPNVPFLAGQMGEFSERPWTEFKRRVDEAHRQLSLRTPNVAFVDSVGLRHKGDEVHFDAASYRILGHRFSVAFEKLEQEGASR